MSHDSPIILLLSVSRAQVLEHEPHLLKFCDDVIYMVPTTHMPITRCGFETTRYVLVHYV